MVERADQVGGRFGQRAVEVEDEDAAHVSDAVNDWIFLQAVSRTSSEVA